MSVVNQERMIGQVVISQAISMVTKILKANKVAHIEGSPAIGKSAVVHHIAKHFNLKVIDMRLSQCDPTDLLGFPNIVDGKACYVPMETFPIRGDKLPVRPVTDDPNDPDSGRAYNGWMLFLDEFTSAPRAVQAAAYKIVLDRMVGLHHLHDKVAIVCAGNKDTDGAIVEEMSTALQSRLIHMELVVDSLEWIQWANSKGFDHRIISYLSHQPDKLYTFKADHTDKTYAAPRTWDFANDILKVSDLNDPDTAHLLAGTLGLGVSHEFRGFCDVYSKIPTILDIIAAPATCLVPPFDDPGSMFAVTGTIGAHAKAANMAPLIEYLKRLPAEFQIVALRHIMQRDSKMIANPDIQKWVASSAIKLV